MVHVELVASCCISSSKKAQVFFRATQNLARAKKMVIVMKKQRYVDFLFARSQCQLAENWCNSTIMFLIAAIIGDISHDVTGSGFVSFDTCTKACIIYTTLKLVSSRVSSGGKLFCLVLTERNIKPQCRDRCE